ncbi:MULTISPECIES: hypothetical protein [Proteus]|uniref:Uncharacterized protein n=1 Tax=Proteus mirabilis TaxID=584 RepID=A0A2X2DH61_PROMI|nr:MULTISPECIES: hypothetical protein [Proteus]DAH75928.1 MAG TPA: hypothetical protein [Caudoviricetes sp.]EIM6939801.1 hypothetical protein [Proteus mirabilis]EIO2231347.1 hypothetical protein [Proteus mirabilis]EKW6533588.1 hypothetical protein [Proteus mirabilis]EKX8358097.1 hypothetical protein [Proteus mirabilis]
MAKKRRFINQNQEERVHPDSPDGLLVAAAKNRNFGKRFVEEFRKQQGGQHVSGNKIS